MPVSRLAVLALGLLFLAGCGPARLDVSKSLDLEAGEARSIDLDAQSKPQSVTVEFSSPADVTVCLFKRDDCKTDDDLITASTSKAIAFKTGKTGTVTGDIPENTAARVVIRNPGDKVKVDVKVTNKK